MLPLIMKDSLEYLQYNSFILDSPTDKSIKLREIAVEYADKISISNKIKTILLTGSSVAGYSGMGSDIDLDVLIDGNTRPIKKASYKGVTIDLQYKSEKDWKNECLNGGEAVKYLTHTVPVYDRTGMFLAFQREILDKFYSEDSIKKEYERSKAIVETRCSLGIEEAKAGQFIPSAIRIESGLYESVYLLIYKHKGLTATSLMLSELQRISTKLGHIEWFDKVTKYMRFNITKDRLYELLKTYDNLFVLMREKLSSNMDIVKRIRRMRLDIFSAGSQLIELCSETNYQQLFDKVERAILNNKEYNAALALFFESHYNYFMFAPFFYLKNIKRDASSKMVLSQTFNDLFECWDDDIKQSWEEVYRASDLSQESLEGMSNLSHEILSYCL